MINLRFVLICISIGYVSSQAITTGMMSKIFQYAKTAAVSTLTATLNSQSSAADQISKTSSWADKNFGIPPKGATGYYTVKSNAVAKADQFYKHREALKIFCGILRVAINKALGTSTCSTLMNLYWQEDRKANNNITVALQNFKVLAVQKMPPSQISKLQTIMNQARIEFATKNPAAAQNLMSFTM